MSHGQKVNAARQHEHRIAPRGTSGQPGKGQPRRRPSVRAPVHMKRCKTRETRSTRLSTSPCSSAAGGVSFTHRQSSRDRPGGSCILPPSGVSRNGLRRQIGIRSLVRLPARSFAQCALLLVSRARPSFVPRKTPCPKRSSNDCTYSLRLVHCTVHCFSWTFCRTAHTQGSRP